MQYKLEITVKQLLITVREFLKMKTHYIPEHWDQSIYN